MIAEYQHAYLREKDQIVLCTFKHDIKEILCNSYHPKISFYSEIEHAFSIIAAQIFFYVHKFNTLSVLL